MYKKRNSISIALVCVLVTQTIVSHDIHCLFGKQPCTQEQKKRLIKKGLAVTALVILLACAGIGAMRLLKREKKELVIRDSCEEKNDSATKNEQPKQQEEPMIEKKYIALGNGDEQEKHSYVQGGLGGAGSFRDLLEYKKEHLTEVKPLLWMETYGWYKLDEQKLMVRQPSKETEPFSKAIALNLPKT